MPTRSSSSVRVFYPRFDKAALVQLLQERLRLLDPVLPLQQVVLFGSYATGRHTVASDIDVLIVYRGKPRADAYALTRQILDIRGLEPHVYTEHEYEAASATVERMIAGGDVLLARPDCSFLPLPPWRGRGLR